MDMPILDRDELETDDAKPAPDSSTRASASETAKDEEGITHGV
jgi:hypothetical protein